MRERLYLSTTDPSAGDLARRYGLGLEIASFCTVWNMDAYLPETERELEATLAGISRWVLHGPFNELFPCAIDPKARELARYRYRQAIVQAVNDPRIRLCLDVGHANAYSKIPVSEWLEESADFLSHLHIHNNDGSGDSHSPLQEGSIPIRRLLARAFQRCPEATATLELPQSEPAICWLLEEDTWRTH